MRDVYLIFLSDKPSPSDDPDAGVVSTEWFMVSHSPFIGERIDAVRKLREGPVGTVVQIGTVYIEALEAEHMKDCIASS